ncbi:MAG TPA: damage-inducible protein DinB [Bacteroidetes bacterium]|nr:damage-inducible protein DinB [Bacteroidota bacterium]
MLQDLFSYNQDSNQRLIQAFIENRDQVTPKSIELMSHIINAHHIWNARIGQHKPDFGVWHIHNISDFLALDTSNHENTGIILDQSNLESVLEYKNSRGQFFQNKVSDILFHIINHSTYHRGQIAYDFRLNGVEPIVSDFIFYKR